MFSGRSGRNYLGLSPHPFDYYDPPPFFFQMSGLTTQTPG